MRCVCVRGCVHVVVGRVVSRSGVDFEGVVAVVLLVPFGSGFVVVLCAVVWLSFEVVSGACVRCVCVGVSGSPDLQLVTCGSGSGALCVLAVGWEVCECCIGAFR